MEIINGILSDPRASATIISALIVAIGIYFGGKRWKKERAQEFRRATFLRYVDLYSDNDTFDAALKAFHLEYKLKAYGVSKSELQYLVRKALLFKMWIKVDAIKHPLHYPKGCHPWYVAQAIMRPRPKAPRGIWDLVEPFVGVEDIRKAIQRSS